MGNSNQMQLNILLTIIGRDTCKIDVDMFEGWFTYHILRPLLLWCWINCDHPRGRNWGDLPKLSKEKQPIQFFKDFLRNAKGIALRFSREFPWYKISTEHGKWSPDLIISSFNHYLLRIATDNVEIYDKWFARHITVTSSNSSNNEWNALILADITEDTSPKLLKRNRPISIWRFSPRR